jgi:hypothetical protein
MGAFPGQRVHTEISPLRSFGAPVEMTTLLRRIMHFSLKILRVQQNCHRDRSEA